MMNSNKPDFQDLDQLDTAVLLQKMVVLNGILHYGTEEEKEKAVEELKKIEPVIQKAVNVAAFTQAKYELNISDEELAFATPFRLF